MIIQKIKGGLGNQMFQYAYIKGLATRRGEVFKLDIIEFKTYMLHKYCLDIFDLDVTYAVKQNRPFYENLYSKKGVINQFLIQIKGLFRRLNPNHYIEQKYSFSEDELKINSGYIEGYFQSEKYFKDIEDIIRKDFTFIGKLDNKNLHIMNKIKETQSVSVHIRRGDYLVGSALKHHGVCDLIHYNKAISYISQHIENPVFFFFSDDIERVKQNFNFDFESYYIDRNGVDKNHEDMRLMSSCKHNIIANSTFSWWGAWLNEYQEKIVIAPSQWFNNKDIDDTDVYCQGRIKI